MVPIYWIFPAWGFSRLGCDIGFIPLDLLRTVFRRKEKGIE